MASGGPKTLMNAAFMSYPHGASLASQGCHWVYPNSPARRNVAGSERHQYEQQRDAGECVGISRTYVEQQSLHHTGQGKRAADANSHSRQNQTEALSDDKPQNITFPRAQCTPDTHFMSPLHHRVCDDSVNPTESE